MIICAVLQHQHLHLNVRYTCTSYAVNFAKAHTACCCDYMRLTLCSLPCSQSTSTACQHLVDMRSRPVLARCRCQGRINHDPFNYRPLWVPAQLILYERPEPMFSVLFDDRGERIKHIMDFTPVPFPCDSARPSAK